MVGAFVAFIRVVYGRMIYMSLPNSIFAISLIFVHVRETINILLSVSSNYFLLYIDICLDIQRFGYSEFCKYRLGLRRKKHVFTKCNSCLPAIQ